jgi:hypothetical protein
MDTVHTAHPSSISLHSKNFMVNEKKSLNKKSTLGFLAKTKKKKKKKNTALEYI